jgi:hypothetical protein
MVSGLMQWAVHITETWCSKIGVLVSLDKTEFVVFAQKRKLPGFFEPLFFVVSVHRSMLVKYLRVILASQPSWREHVHIKVKKTLNLLACSRAYGATWSLRPKVVYWLYVFIIQPSITFASLVWWPGCQTSSVKARLSRIHRLVCLGITGAVCTAATVAMEACAFLHWFSGSG